MNTRDAVGVEAILLAKESELLAGLTKREGLETEAEADFFDQILQAANRVLMTRALDRNSFLLREVRAALARIHNGSYGRCLQCDDAISAKRLEAVPWASLCLPCQEGADREAADHREAFEFAALGAPRRRPDIPPAHRAAQLGEIARSSATRDWRERLAYLAKSSRPETGGGG
jgi:DnaK suppressor protein